MHPCFVISWRTLNILGCRVSFSRRDANDGTANQITRFELATGVAQAAATYPTIGTR